MARIKIEPPKHHIDSDNVEGTIAALNHALEALEGRGKPPGPDHINAKAYSIIRQQREAIAVKYGDWKAKQSRKSKAGKRNYQQHPVTIDEPEMSMAEIIRQRRAFRESQVQQ
ncbi:MAG: hypothetical protein AAF125_22985 [Chloroflexota bacterium]